MTQLSEVITFKFLSLFFPSFSASTLNKIASNVSNTMIALVTALDNCFLTQYSNLLDQIVSFFPYSQAFGQFWKNEIPEIEKMRSIPLDFYDVLTSPWTPSIDDEEFVANVFEQLIR